MSVRHLSSDLMYETVERALSTCSEVLHNAPTVCATNTTFAQICRDSLLWRSVGTRIWGSSPSTPSTREEVLAACQPGIAGTPNMSVTNLCTLSNNRIAIGGIEPQEDVLCTFNVINGEWMELPIPVNRRFTKIESICELSNARIAAACGTIVGIWNSVDGEILHELPHPEFYRIGRHLPHVTNVCALPQNRIVSTTITKLGGRLYSPYRYDLYIWDLDNRTIVKTIPFDRTPITSVCALPNHRIAIACGSSSPKYVLSSELPDQFSGDLMIYDIQRNTELSSIPEEDCDGIEGVCKLTDGRVAGCSRNGNVKIWDANGSVVYEFANKHHDAVDICSLPDNRIATVGEQTVCIWDVRMGRRVRTLTGHSGRVTCVCALPGNRVASGSHDETVRIWNL
jgi:WD40 repeat protein